MRRAAAALIVFSAEVPAHPGHGATAGHFHGLGAEHLLLIVVVLAVLAFAVMKK